MEHYRLKPGEEEKEKSEAKDEFEVSAEEEGQQSIVTSEVDREWFEGAKEAWEKGMWEETFKSWTDLKPKGQYSASFVRSEGEMNELTVFLSPSFSCSLVTQVPKLSRSISASLRLPTSMEFLSTLLRCLFIRPSESSRFASSSALGFPPSSSSST